MELNFKKSIVKRGTKAVDESSAQLFIRSSYNGFRLNNKACKLLGITPGKEGENRVVMFDMKHEGATSQQDRYYIANAAGMVDENGVPEGAKVSKLRDFQYAVIYGTMILNDFDTESITARGLEEKGLIIEGKKLSEKGNVIYSRTSTVVGTADIIPFNDGEPVEIAEGVEVPIYQVTNITLREHTPKSMEVDVNEEVDI